MFNLFKKDTDQPELKVPGHIGIIMDGNGRWAKKRLQPRMMGHKAGMDALQEVTIRAAELGVKVLTVYAFSTENWSRPADEVSFIMKLPVEFFDKYVPELDRHHVCVQMIGETEQLPKDTLAALERAIAQTADNTGLILNFALNYGGRSELTSAIKRLVADGLSGQLTADEISEDLVADYLMTADLPAAYRDPDLIIRTSGEKRLSNFLPWQAAYSEFYFTDVLWPDFKAAELDEALAEYSRRHRRFGGI